MQDASVVASMNHIISPFRIGRAPGQQQVYQDEEECGGGGGWRDSGPRSRWGRSDSPGEEQRGRWGRGSSPGEQRGGWGDNEPITNGSPVQDTPLSPVQDTPLSPEMNSPPWPGPKTIPMEAAPKAIPLERPMEKPKLSETERKNKLLSLKSKLEGKSAKEFSPSMFVSSANQDSPRSPQEPDSQRSEPVLQVSSSSKGEVNFVKDVFLEKLISSAENPKRRKGGKAYPEGSGKVDLQSDEWKENLLEYDVKKLVKIDTKLEIQKRRQEAKLERERKENEKKDAKAKKVEAKKAQDEIKRKEKEFKDAEKKKQKEIKEAAIKKKREEKEAAKQKKKCEATATEVIVTENKENESSETLNRKLNFDESLPRSIQLTETGRRKTWSPPIKKPKNPAPAFIN